MSSMTIHRQVTQGQALGPCSFPPCQEHPATLVGHSPHGQELRVRARHCELLLYVRWLLDLGLVGLEDAGTPSAAPPEGG
jgi:hypothetical protein